MILKMCLQGKEFEFKVLPLNSSLVSLVFLCCMHADMSPLVASGHIWTYAPHQGAGHSVKDTLLSYVMALRSHSAHRKEVQTGPHISTTLG